MHARSRLLLFVTAISAAVAVHAAGARLYRVGPGVSISPPSGEGAAQPFLSTTPDGRVLMSWIERTEMHGAHAFRYSLFDGRSWSKPQTVAQGPEVAVNFLDFPSMQMFAGGRLVGHWLEKNGSRGVDVRLVQSADAGATWKTATPYSDRSVAGHGFVTLVPLSGGARTGVLWLDGRNVGDGEGETMLRYSVADASGKISREVELDSRTCDCCQTDMAATASGLVAVYRDRSRNEIRDISVIRQTPRGWSSPVPIHADGWRIQGCPLNGPQIAARGNRVVVAWFTGAGNVPRVYAAFSADGGASFGKALRLDGGAARGRVDVALLPDDSALVTWVEQNGGAAQVIVRQVRADGTAGRAIQLTGTSPGGTSGVPRIALTATKLYVAWPEGGDVPHIRMAAVPLERTR